MTHRFKRLLRQLAGLVPTKIPVGVTEFNKWADDFIETYTLPTQDSDSLKFTLASIIMHLGPQVAYKPKFYFYLTINAAAAKQVAGSVFYEIKQKAKLAEEAARKAQEANNESQNQEIPSATA